MKHTLIVIVLFLLASCTNKDKNPLPETLMPLDSMVLIVADMQLIEAANAVHIIQGHDPKKMAIRYYAGVFEKHHISQERFTQSMAYYHNDAALTEKLYAEVIETLSEMQAKAANE